MSDRNPSVHEYVKMEPRLYRVAVRVTTPDGKPVSEGVVRVEGVEEPFTASIDISREREVRLKVGAYRFTYASDAYRGSLVEVRVASDEEVAIVAERTAVRVRVRVVDEAGAPLSGAKVRVEGRELPAPIEVVTNAAGEAVALAPYNATLSISASAPARTPARVEALVATEEVEERPVTLTLVRVRGNIVVLLQDEAGAPEVGSVTVRDSHGSVVRVLSVVGSAVLDADLGTYTVEAVTPDGRAAGAVVVVLTEGAPTGTATLVVPRRSPPLYVEAYPYLVLAVAGATAAVVVYRKFFRRARPRRVEAP